MWFRELVASSDISHTMSFVGFPNCSLWIFWVLFCFCFVSALQKLLFAEHADIWNNETKWHSSAEVQLKKWNSNQFDWQKIKYNWFLIPLIYYLLLSEMSPLRVNWAYGCPHQLRVHAHYSSFVASYLCIYNIHIYIYMCVYMYIYSPKSLRSSAKST